MYLTLVRSSSARSRWPTGSSRPSRSSRRCASARRRPRSTSCARRSATPRRSTPWSAASSAPGRIEKEIAAFVHAEIARRGLGHAWEEATCPAVFTGPGGAEAHYAPGERKVERGHVLNMDFGVKVGAYVSDMQRTFYVLDEGETEAPAEVQKGFDTIVARDRGGEAGDAAGCRGARDRRGGARPHHRRRLRGVPARARPPGRPVRPRRHCAARPHLGEVRREAAEEAAARHGVHHRAAADRGRARHLHGRGDGRRHRDRLRVALRPAEASSS